jgi:TRAP-type C4-dicarboxylate transport system substrate-binding protein
MKRKITLLFVLTAITILFIIVNINLASAQQKIFKLKWASPMPPRHASAQLWEWYGAELEKRSGGRVKITYYHAGSLGAGPVIWENILKGIADVGAIGNYTPGKHPVENNLIQTLPFRIPNPHVTGDIFWNLYYKGLLDHEIGEYKFLYPQPTELYSLITTKKKADKIDDFKGLRIRVPGVSPTLKAFGVGTVAMPVPELYNAVERGIVDGILAGVTIIPAAKLENLVKYINVESFGVGNWYICMNKKVWKSLPADIQVIVNRLSQEAYYRNLEDKHTTVSQIISDLKARGVVIYGAEPEELKRWKALTGKLFTDWTAEMDAKGLPGKQIKEETLRVLAQHGVDPEIR